MRHEKEKEVTELKRNELGKTSSSHACPTKQTKEEIHTKHLNNFRITITKNVLLFRFVSSQRKKLKLMNHNSARVKAVKAWNLSSISFGERKKLSFTEIFPSSKQRQFQFHIDH